MPVAAKRCGRRQGESHPTPCGTGKKTPGGAGTRDTHGTHGRTRAHGSHRRTSQPSKPNDTPHPHVARPRDGRNRLNRGRLPWPTQEQPQARSRPLPAADSEEAAPSKPDPNPTLPPPAPRAPPRRPALGACSKACSKAVGEMKARGRSRQMRNGRRCGQTGTALTCTAQPGTGTGKKTPGEGLGLEAPVRAAADQSAGRGRRGTTLHSLPCRGLAPPPARARPTKPRKRRRARQPGHESRPRTDRHHVSGDSASRRIRASPRACRFPATAGPRVRLRA